MKSTLADVKQLFNVKAMAAAGLTVGTLPEGQFGIIDTTTGLTVVPANFAALPNEFSLVSKLGGKIYYGFAPIKKENLKNKIAKPYVAQQINIWKGKVESCSCISSVQLVINIDEASLMQRDGLTWAHRDFVVEVSNQEMKCFCSCDGSNPAYENNIMTKLLIDKINGFNSPFYEAEAQLDDGTVITDLDQFIEDNKAVNTDDDDTNDGQYLNIVLKGKVMNAGNYADLDVNYIYPRGVRLTPALIIDGNYGKVFTETQPLRFEIGAGYDLRAEEWENMNYYTDLNYYTRLSDGIQSANLVYQFENATNYNTITFEFTTDMVERNNGDKRLFGVMLGASTTSVYNALKAAFGL